MDMDFALRLGQFLFPLIVGVFSITAARRASSRAEAEELAGRLRDHGNRILVLEQRMDHLPDGKQLADLAGDMKAIKAELAGVARELAPLARSVDRINDYLLNARPQ